MVNITEAQARQLTTCPTCGDNKGSGLIVCWSCFKDNYEDFSGNRREALKFSPLSDDEWLAKYANPAYINAHELAEVSKV